MQVVSTFQACNGYSGIFFLPKSHMCHIPRSMTETWSFLYSGPADIIIFYVLQYFIDSSIFTNALNVIIFLYLNTMPMQNIFPILEMENLKTVKIDLGNRKELHITENCFLFLFWAVVKFHVWNVVLIKRCIAFKENNAIFVSLVAGVVWSALTIHHLSGSLDVFLSNDFERH